MAAAPFDLIIRNGRVIDPANDLNEIADVGVKDKKITSVAPHIEERGQKEFDASGCIVTPGLIDGHVHIYQHVTPLGVNVDETCLARGVTTVVDAGSAGRNRTNTVLCRKGIELWGIRRCNIWLSTMHPPNIRFRT